MKRSLAVFVALALCVGAAAVFVSRARPEVAPVPVAPTRPAAKLLAVGPRLTSNQTSQPLAVYGEGLEPGMRLALGPPLSRELALKVVDGRHAYARLPGELPLPAGMPQVNVKARLLADPGTATEGEARLDVVNDTAFPDLVELAVSPDGSQAFIASPPTDTVYAVELGSGAVRELKTADGPSALATYKDAGGRGWLAIAHRFSPELRLYALDGSGASRVLPAPAGAMGLAVDARGEVAFVAEQVRDTVRALSLEDGKERWAAAVDPNPRSLAPWKELLAVGGQQTGQVELLRQSDGERVSTVVPAPGVPIVGGGTERFSAQVMGGKATRGMVASERLGRLFFSSLGPNVGPNVERMEVSANGGVGVVDPARRVMVRHRGFGAGITEGLALDETGGLLYAADIGLGQVRVVDARRLVESEVGARKALLQELPIPLPENTPRARPDEDYGKEGRAGVELHSGPRALALAPDGRTLYVLNRFTGTLAVVDVSEARTGRARVVRQLPVTEMRTQPKRRLGQVLYYADMGRTAMSCDACHVEGHTGGVFFEKTRPMRIYRSTTVRGSRDTPPYFTPASTHSIGETIRTVGNRNRYQNPLLTDAEVEALTLFTALVPTLPNPFVGEDGAPPETLELPDGRSGRPGEGRALFEGKAGCAACHPAPLYTLDQTAETRGRYLEVGTPLALPLRLEQQDLVPGAAPPALMGAWDVWPMLTSAAAGYEVRGDQLVVGTRFPLRAVIESAGPAHGNAQALTPQERDDLLAFLLTL
ncbi:MtsA protein [Hyalangium rubrum]|uniref:MtsA protein n=1 Tax=Hyalangium rubrum TaxID=3103134 RepID=A0ABU5GZB2_9BACT|nr:MtsA protein [Hyalangium sp. s54d21]MDY7226536.1 MtsA protein [Hyalangium sp. s54d21]